MNIPDMKTRFFTLFLIAASLSSAWKSPASAAEKHVKDSNLRKGAFLVAVPHLIDPHFSRTVILLIMYEKEGAVGLIINRPTRIPIKRALPNLKEAENLSSSLFFGGPVSQERILALFRSDKSLDETQKVFDDVYVAESIKPLAQMLQSPQPEKNLRIYSGYAGWGPGQLDGEVARGDWLIIAADPEAIFSENTSDIWKELLKKGEKIEVDSRDNAINVSMVW